MQKGLTKKSDYKTKGLVKSWKIISESYSSLSGKWTVEVEVTIEKIVEFKLSKETERVRIAISPFRTVDQKFSRFFEESLNSYLAQSRKFAMFDRKYTQEQSSELAKYRNSNFRKGEVSRIGNMLGVDYIVVGDVAEFKEQTNNSIKLKTINVPFKKKKIFIDISFRVIDVATGQVNYSGYLAEAFLKDKNYSIINLSRKVAGLIGNKIINSIYPITVMQVDGDRVILAQGGDTLSVGDKFNLIQYGKELFDPYTNESLGYSENRIGVIEVLDVQNKLSTARIVSLNVQKLNTSSRMIVRPVLKKKEATTSSTIRNINLPKVKVKDIDKDGDW
jgi:curli biogenesis system outer membrane secretion channel CsgG